MQTMTPTVQFWPYFSNIFETAVGYPADDFEFVAGETSLSTFKEAALCIATYYAVILGGRELMRNREPFKLTSLFLVHNFILTAISAVLLGLFAEELLPTLARDGVFYAICDYRGGWTQHLVTLYYLSYLAKYLELLDTAFLVLKKKPLTFLHCYHHGITAFLCYTQLIGNTAVSWVPITLNLAVHVVMYWYYFQSARGIHVWWKVWVTRLQIIQFIIGLGFIYFASYAYFAAAYFPLWFPKPGKCAGEEFAALTGMAVITSYLVLFLSFYLFTYKKGKKGGRSARSAVRRMFQVPIPEGNKRE